MSTPHSYNQSIAATSDGCVAYSSPAVEYSRRAVGREVVTFVERVARDWAQAPQCLEPFLPPQRPTPHTDTRRAPMNRLLLCGLAISAVLATTGGASGSGQSGRYQLQNGWPSKSAAQKQRAMKAKAAPRRAAKSRARKAAPWTSTSASANSRTARASRSSRAGNRGGRGWASGASRPRNRPSASSPCALLVLASSVSGDRRTIGGPTRAIITALSG